PRGRRRSRRSRSLDSAVDPAAPTHPAALHRPAGLATSVLAAAAGLEAGTRRVRRAAFVGGAAFALAASILVATPAAADNVSSTELRNLAHAAQTDPAALARLRAVDR